MVAIPALNSNLCFAVRLVLAQDRSRQSGFRKDE